MRKLWCMWLAIAQVAALMSVLGPTLAAAQTTATITGRLSPASRSQAEVPEPFGVKPMRGSAHWSAKACPQAPFEA